MKGKKTGGRTAGTPNKKTAELVEAVEESGVTPLEFLLGVMRNESQESAVGAMLNLLAEAFDGRQSVTFAELKEGINPNAVIRMIEQIGRSLDERVKAATAAAPYVHQRLAQTTHKFGEDNERYFGLALLGVNKDDPREITHGSSNGTGNGTESPTQPN